MLQPERVALRAVRTAGVVPGTCNVLAIDASLTATGVAHCDWQGLRVGLLAPPDKPKLRDGARLEWFYRRFHALLLQTRPDAVFIEGYAFGAANKREALGELGGVIRLLCTIAQVPYYEVPPATLKQFVTGKAQVEKSVVSKELFKRYDVDLNENNEVDAAALAILGVAVRGGGVETTADQRKAVAKAAGSAGMIAPSSK